MEFTPLHRLLGRQPGPLTDDMLDAAIEQGIRETDDLDWKSGLPKAKDLSQSDVVKDIAAMANSGGGMIVFGIKEKDKAANGREDVGKLDQTYERTLRSVAVSGIQPPVFGLGIYELGAEGARVLAVVVPPSVDVPHLIYKNDYFGAPIRNDADTAWMRERQIESLYRARLDERRAGATALRELYAENAVGRDTDDRAWFIGVARPRIANPLAARVDARNASAIFQRASGFSAACVGTSQGYRPLLMTDNTVPRPGLRRWIAPFISIASNSKHMESWASVHYDGSVAVASALGGVATNGGAGNQVNSPSLEACVSDLMALVRAASAAMGSGDYEVRAGLEWTGLELLAFDPLPAWGGFPSREPATTVATYLPVTISVRTDVDDAAFGDQVVDLAEDLVNQGGVLSVCLLKRSSN
jgi:Putative DNA-binding domain